MRPRLRRSSGRILTSFALLMLFVSGCAEAPASGVSVKSLAADLVFGIPELPEPVPPPNTDLSPDQPLGVVGTRPSGRPQFDSGFLPPPPPECKEASPTDFPEQEATTVVQGSPKEGFYNWIVASEQQVQGVGPVVSHRSIERSIEDVEIVGGVTRYTTVEQDLVFGAQRTVKQTYEVRQGAGQEEGIYLIRRESKTASNPGQEFVPVPPILVLDLPVAIGRSVNSSGVDPNSLEVQQQEGIVASRNRVDACGKLIDSWMVETKQTFTNRRGERTERRYNYSVATQLGGFIVFEHIESPFTNPTLKIDARIGQIEPSATSRAS